MSLVITGSAMCLQCQTHKALFCICEVHPSDSRSHVQAPLRNHKMPHHIIGETIARGLRCMIVPSEAYKSFQIGNTISLTHETIETVFNITAYDGCFGYRFAQITHIVKCKTLEDAIQLAGHKNVIFDELMEETLDYSTEYPVMVFWFV